MGAVRGVGCSGRWRVCESGMAIGGAANHGCSRLSAGLDAQESASAGKIACPTAACAWMLIFKQFFLASLVIVSCAAQETAEITGRIVDPTGSVAPGAEIEIRHAGTNSAWQVRSNRDGYYTQALLPPGDYRVTVRLSGFKQEVRTLTLEVQQVSRLDFTLQVGTATETIEVTGAAPMLESSNAS